MNDESQLSVISPQKRKRGHITWQVVLCLTMSLLACSQESENNFFSRIDHLGVHFTQGQFVPIDFADTAQLTIVLFPILRETELNEPSSLDMLKWIEANVFQDMYIPDYLRIGPTLAAKIKLKVANLKTYQTGKEQVLNDQFMQKEDKSTIILLTTTTGRDRFLHNWETPDFESEDKWMHVLIYKPNIGVQIMKFPMDRHLWGKSIIFGTIAEL